MNINSYNSQISLQANQRQGATKLPPDLVKTIEVLKAKPTQELNQFLRKQPDEVRIDARKYLDRQRFDALSPLEKVGKVFDNVIDKVTGLWPKPKPFKPSDHDRDFSVSIDP
jgi:hypothetical protein